MGWNDLAGFVFISMIANVVTCGAAIVIAFRLSRMSRAAR
jgi:hypothetical protein